MLLFEKELFNSHNFRSSLSKAMKKVSINLDSVGLQPIKLVGSGSDGIVVKAVNNNTKQVFAVKVVPISNDKVKLFEREAMNTLRLANHPNIIQVKGYHKLTPEYGIIVMEYMRCDLMSYYLSKSKISEKEVKKMFKMMCQAVLVCHENQIAHLDIKPENFLLDKSKKSLKLCDFHRSIDWQNDSDISDTLLNQLTSVKYRPPELLNKTSRNDLTKVDVWCLGVSLFGLLFGFFPFHFSGVVDDELDYDLNQLNRYLNESDISSEAKELTAYNFEI